MRPKWMILLTNVSTSLSLWAAFDDVPQGNDILNKCQYLIEFMSCFKQCAPSGWNGTVQLVGDWSTSYNWWRLEESVCWDWCGLWHHLQGIYVEHAWDHDKWEGKKDLLTLVIDSCCLQLQSTDPHLLIHLFLPNIWTLGPHHCFPVANYPSCWLQQWIRVSQVYSQLISNICTDALSAEKVLWRGSYLQSTCFVWVILSLRAMFFFWWRNFTMGDPKKSSAKATKEFLGKKEPMSPYIDHDIWPNMANMATLALLS